MGQLAVGVELGLRVALLIVQSPIQTPGIVAGQHQGFAGVEAGFQVLYCAAIGSSPAAVGEHRQTHAGRAAIVEDFVDCGARGAAGIEHVVGQQDVAALDLERYRGRLDLRVQALSAKSSR